MIKKESIITKTNGTFRMSAIKYTYRLYKNNTLNYWKGVFRQGYKITRRYWHHYRVRALYLQARGIRDRLCIVHCCQSIGERGKEPQMAALAEVSGATRLHVSLLLVTLAGMTHMPSLRLCCATRALCPSPVLGGWVEGTKAKTGPQGWKPLSYV